MRLYRGGGCLVVGVVLVLGSAAGEASDSSSDEAAIRANVAAFEAAWNARDAAGVAATYSADGDVVVVDAPRVAGREAVRRAIADQLARLPADRRIRLTVRGIRRIRPDAAIVETTAEFNGGAVRSDRGTSVMVREDGRWVAAALRVYPAEAAGVPPGPDKASDEDRQGVLDARARLIRALDTDDVHGLLALLTADHVTMAPDESALDARALRAWHERRIAAFATKGTWTLDDLRVEGDSAVDSWHCVLSLTPRAGGVSVSMAAKGVWFWRREPDGRWRLARSIWNGDSPAAAVDLGAEKAAIEKLLAAQLAATNQAGEAGADGYVSVATDGVLWLPPNGQRVTGRKAVRDLLLPLTSAKRWSASWKADAVEIAASGDIAYAVGTYELSHEGAGGTLIRDTGKFLDTFRKADGRWQETTIMFSSDLPAGGAARR